jgi:hypothetical protein
VPRRLDGDRPLHGVVATFTRQPSGDVEHPLVAILLRRWSVDRSSAAEPADRPLSGTKLERVLGIPDTRQCATDRWWSGPCCHGHGTDGVGEDLEAVASTTVSSAPKLAAAAPRVVEVIVGARVAPTCTGRRHRVDERPRAAPEASSSGPSTTDTQSTRPATIPAATATPVDEAGTTTDPGTPVGNVRAIRTPQFLDRSDTA